MTSTRKVHLSVAVGRYYINCAGVTIEVTKKNAWGIFFGKHEDIGYTATGRAYTMDDAGLCKDRKEELDLARPVYISGVAYQSDAGECFITNVSPAGTKVYPIVGEVGGNVRTWRADGCYYGQSNPYKFDLLDYSDKEQATGRPPELVEACIKSNPRKEAHPNVVPHRLNGKRVHFDYDGKRGECEVVGRKPSGKNFAVRLLFSGYGHSCSGLVPKGRGWWVPEDRLIDPDAPEKMPKLAAAFRDAAAMIAPIRIAPGMCAAAPKEDVLPAPLAIDCAEHMIGRMIQLNTAGGQKQLGVVRYVDSTDMAVEFQPAGFPFPLHNCMGKIPNGMGRWIKRRGELDGTWSFVDEPKATDTTGPMGVVQPSELCGKRCDMLVVDEDQPLDNRDRDAIWNAWSENFLDDDTNPLSYFIEQRRKLKAIR
jgi:hypothetical protein